MALTITRVLPQPIAGSLPSSLIAVTLDDKYPAGGWPVTGKELGLPNNQVIAVVLNPVIAGILFSWDVVNQTLVAHSGALAVLTTNSAAANGLVLMLLAFAAA